MVLGLGVGDELKLMDRQFSMEVDIYITLSYSHYNDVNFSDDYQSRTGEYSGGDAATVEYGFV